MMPMSVNLTSPAFLFACLTIEGKIFILNQNSTSLRFYYYWTLVSKHSLVGLSVRRVLKT